MIWFDGQVWPDGPVPFDLRDRGLLLGDGLFETLLVVAGVPVWLDAHLDRLAAAARVIGLPVERGAVGHAVTALAGRQEAPAVLRVTVTRGVGNRGLRVPDAARPLVIAAASRWDPAAAFVPVRLATAATRRNATSPLSRVKSLGYLDNVLALEGAVAAGADDALLVSTEGRVACTSTGNVFALFGSTLATPPVVDGVLPGIARATVLRLAASQGLVPLERSLLPEQLPGADALFTTNSVRLLCPVTSLDGRAVPRHLAVDRLATALREAVLGPAGSVGKGAGDPLPHW